MRSNSEPSYAGFFAGNNGSWHDQYYPPTGTLLEIIPPKGDTYQSYLRVQVQINISEPLQRGTHLRLSEGSWSWKPFTYEDLPIYCFLCGIVRHIERKCQLRFTKNFIDPGTSFLCGEWLKANTQGTQTGGNRAPLSSLYSSSQPIISTNWSLGSEILEFRQIPTTGIVNALQILAKRIGEWGVHRIWSWWRVLRYRDRWGLTKRQPSVQFSNLRKQRTERKKKRQLRIHIHRRDFRLDPNSGGGCLAAPPIIMSCLLWNCRGLGFPLTVQVLRDMICLLNPELVAETRCTPGYVDSLKTQRNVFGLTVDIIGMSGGLALLWRKNVDVSLLSLSPHHIDVEVNQPTGGSRGFTDIQNNTCVLVHGI